jgi:hypothetical protein
VFPNVANSITEITVAQRRRVPPEEIPMDPQDYDSTIASSAEPDWRTLIENKWVALGREALGPDSNPRPNLAKLARACQSLASIAAWFESKGNITQAAARVGTSRKALRERIVEWRKDNPQLVPPRPAKHPKPRKRRGRGRKRETAGQRLIDDGTEDTSGAAVGTRQDPAMKGCRP